MINLSFACTRSSLYHKDKNSGLTSYITHYPFFLSSGGHTLSQYSNYFPWYSGCGGMGWGGTSQGNMPYLSTILYRNDFFQVLRFTVLFLSSSHLLSVILHTIDCLFSLNFSSLLSVLSLKSSPLSITLTLLLFFHHPLLT